MSYTKEEIFTCDICGHWVAVQGVPQDRISQTTIHLGFAMLGSPARLYECDACTDCLGALQSAIKTAVGNVVTSREARKKANAELRDALRREAR